MSTNSPNNPFSREGAESLAHTVRQAQRAMEEHPLSAVHINQGSADAMADAYDAEYQASRTMTTTPNAPEVDVLAVIIRDANDARRFRADTWPDLKTVNDAVHDSNNAYNAVAALLTREAALVAERDALAAEVERLRERQTTYSDKDVLDEVRAMVKLCFESQAAFAKSRNVSHAYVSDILNGRRAMPEQWAVLAGFSRPKWFRDTPKRWTDAARTGGAK